MGRVIIGAAIAAFAMFIIGFVFYASGIQNLAFHDLDNNQAAAVQQALAANVPGTGTYSVPAVSTPEQTAMYGKGPIATIHYNSRGFSATDGASLVSGLVLDFVVALLIGLALLGIQSAPGNPSGTMRLTILFSVAAAAYVQLKEPIFFHHDWLVFIYQFVADTVTLAAAGLIISRWFLPGAKAPAMPAENRDS